MDGREPRDEPRPPGRFRALGLAIGATGLIYVVGVIGFLAMIWTLFQLLIWVFTG